MRKPIEIRVEFIGTALSIMMDRAGITDLTFTKEEFTEMVKTNQWISLDGEFTHHTDAVPTSVTFHLCKDEDIKHDLH